MSFFSLLGSIFIGPLKLIFEVIFQVSYELIWDPGFCIIVLSLCMNLLVLPLYKRADAMQEQARDKENALSKGIKHIKKTFSGNERMMMLQTYYRQNDYSPANALKGSVSLLLEIPFFMAAYQFLSNLDLLQGTAFGLISDLGSPDRLLTIGGLTINLLPIVMTLINFISSAIYLKGFPLKNKIQIYGIAVAFLVLLYNSPAGLVFYWTLNNVFSLGKNIVMKLLMPRLQAKKAAKKAAAKAPVPETAKSIKKAEKKQKRQEKRAARTYEPDRKLFIIAGVFLTVFIGLLIPSAYIAASPQEFVDLKVYFSPLWYIVNAFCVAAGFFLLWFSVFYWLAKPKGKVVFERILVILCITGVINYMFFGRDLGVVSSLLKYEGGLVFSTNERVINGVVFIGLTVLLIFTVRRFKTAFRILIGVAALAFLVMSGINTREAARGLKDLPVTQEDEHPHFGLSRNGRNVVVLFLDRAMGQYMPYFIQEKPELKEIYDGFTYYSNVISYGGHTNFGAPPIMGGYEYTPVEMNRRSTEDLKDKHNESLKVMPVLFDNNGFNVTVCDAPYADYKWVSDLSIYNEYPKIQTYMTKGAFESEETAQEVVSSNLRNFFCFSLMKASQLELQLLMYNGGQYYKAGEAIGSVTQLRRGISVASCMRQTFLDSFSVLERMNDMTDILADDSDNYLFFYNDSPHEIMLMQEPEYVPSPRVNNKEYDRTHQDRFTVNGHTIHMEEDDQMMHYQTNMAVLLKVGEWLDYLRKEGVYDNTRIIIVSDHGFHLYEDDNLIFELEGNKIDADNYYPLMMVKDFNATGFTVSDTFMTNADVPAISAEGIIEDPVNPFTGNPINSDEKTAHDQFITLSKDYDVGSNNGKAFSSSWWASVHDNIHDRNNWEFLTESKVLKEHKFPE